MKKPVIGVIGIGRVGSAFIRELTKSGLYIKVILDRNKSKSDRMLEYLRNHDIHASAFLFDLKKCDLIIISVNDDEIQEVCKSLVNESVLKDGSTVVHTSGMVSTRMLNSAKSKGLFTGNIHPILSFPDTESHYPPFDGSWFGIDGDRETIEILTELIKAMGARFIRIKDSNREFYHLAMVFASNYIAALHLVARKILIDKCKIDNETINECLLKLESSVIKNLQIDELGNALSGPIVRGDVTTIKRHINALKGEYPQFLQLYSEMAELISDFLIETPGTDDIGLAEIKKLL